MTTDTDVTYETKTVRAVRGMESRTIKKWETQGWEIVSQSPGTVQTEITFRRPKPKTPPLLWIAGGGVAVLAIAAITVGVIGERNDAPAETAPAPSEAAAAPSEQPSPEPANAAPAPENVVLTPENSPELAALLAGPDCGSDVAAFAAAHRGQTIAFPGNIGAMAPHGDAKTRYDILIVVGDFPSATGPNFQFRDENTINDLHWTGSVPDTIGVGTNLSVTAEVDRYEERSCLFLLEPVTTAVR
ncbi:DUF4839 domain-containing protein [Rhodococcus sp. Q]|uniref:DUF4839 domain-containing protein n=1 Tax=Rhodococcus sp. Q TaxID=2502252 RepID=UPI0010F9B692|nr:DUF4839 domain-containing protein [Rhodococcus sp. Q]